MTIEQAAGNHARRSCVTHVELTRTAEEIDNIAFQAGAEWRKEQIKAQLYKINGMQVWISDPQMKALFTDTINNILAL